MITVIFLLTDVNGTALLQKNRADFVLLFVMINIEKQKMSFTSHLHVCEMRFQLVVHHWVCGDRALLPGALVWCEREKRKAEV